MSVEEFQMKEVELWVLKVKEKTSWNFQLTSERWSQQPSSRATCTLHNSTQYEIFCPRLLSCWRECAQATQTDLRPGAVITRCVCVCSESCCVTPPASRSFPLDSTLFLLCLGQQKRGKKWICHQSLCKISTFEIRQLTSDCFSYSPATFARP